MRSRSSARISGEVMAERWTRNSPASGSSTIRCWRSIFPSLLCRSATGCSSAEPAARPRHVPTGSPPALLRRQQPQGVAAEDGLAVGGGQVHRLYRLHEGALALARANLLRVIGAEQDL